MSANHFSQNGISKRHANYVLFLLCLAYFFDYSDRLVISSLLPFIKAEWVVSDFQLGLLSSIVNLFIAFFVIPMSILVDRWSRRKMVSLMILFWSVVTIACSFIKNFDQLMIARALTGIGEAAYAPAAVAIIAAAFPSDKRGKYTGIWELFAPLGAGVGIAIGGIIGTKMGWRHSFGFVALPGLLVALLFWFTKDYKTVPLFSGSISSGKAFASSIKGLFKIKTIWLIYAAFSCNLAINNVILKWAPSYFNRFFDIDKETAGLISGGIAILALIGAPFGGLIADRWKRATNNGRLFLCATTCAIATISLFLAFNMNSFNSMMIFLTIFGITTVGFLAPASASVQDVVHPGVRALAFGINVCFINLAAFIVPTLVGKLSDMMGLKSALLTVPLLGVLGTILFILSAKAYKKDIKRVEKVELEFEG